LVWLYCMLLAINKSRTHTEREDEREKTREREQRERESRKRERERERERTRIVCFLLYCVLTQCLATQQSQQLVVAIGNTKVCFSENMCLSWF
jgi:hypothetical protein